MSASCALVVDRLSVGYRHRPVLAEVSLTIRAGELLAVIGPNGAGKTTLLRALVCQLRPTTGAVLLDGQTLAGRSPGWLAQRLALAPQGKALDRPLTVYESVALGRAAQRGWLLPLTAHDRAIIGQALAQLGLERLHDRPVTELSAGESQRVVLARALAQEPTVLLVDEPTSHLDLHHQCQVLDHLRQLARQGLAVVLVIHDLNLAGLWADRLALLVGGRLVAVGPPAEVLTAEHLSSAYQVPLAVTQHPISGTPIVTPIPHHYRTLQAP
jgi:iron complex transport system ATP-binding protein